MEHLKFALGVTEGFEQELKETRNLDSKGRPPKFATCSQDANLILGMMSYA